MIASPGDGAGLDPVAGGKALGPIFPESSQVRLLHGSFILQGTLSRRAGRRGSIAVSRPNKHRFIEHGVLLCANTAVTFVVVAEPRQPVREPNHSRPAFEPGERGDACRESSVADC